VGLFRKADSEEGVGLEGSRIAVTVH
jgi:hypothetical protein